MTTTTIRYLTLSSARGLARDRSFPRPLAARSTIVDAVSDVIDGGYSEESCDGDTLAIWPGGSYDGDDDGANDKQWAHAPRHAQVRTLRIDLSHDALGCIEEAGADVASDVIDLATGEQTEARLLAQCLDGAEGDDRVQGWHDYVEACVLAAESVRP